MGINWALTLLGCVALLLVPLPVIFLIYGRRIRARSKFAPGWDLKPKPDVESPVDSPPAEDGVAADVVDSAGAAAGAAKERKVAGEPLAPNPSREFGAKGGAGGGGGV